MSSGHYCVIRDLGPVKGGKGLRHHEVLLDLTGRGLWQGALRLARSLLRSDYNLKRAQAQESTGEPVLVTQATRGTRT